MIAEFLLVKNLSFLMCYKNIALLFFIFIYIFFLQSDVIAHDGSSKVYHVITFITCHNPNTPELPSTYSLKYINFPSNLVHKKRNKE